MKTGQRVTYVGDVSQLYGHSGVISGVTDGNVPLMLVRFDGGLFEGHTEWFCWESELMLAALSAVQTEALAYCKRELGQCSS